MPRGIKRDHDGDQAPMVGGIKIHQNLGKNRNVAKAEEVTMKTVEPE